MNKLNAVDLFSLLPMDIKLKIIDHHDDCREIECECWNCKACNFKIPNWAYKTFENSFGPGPCCPMCCLKYKIISEFAVGDRDEGGARDSWENMKEALNENGGGFIIKHRYDTSEGRFNEPYHYYRYSYRQSPWPWRRHDVPHNIVVIYINITKVNKKTIKYVSAEKILTGNETISDIALWFCECKDNTFAEKLGKIDTSRTWDDVETRDVDYTWKLRNIFLLDL